MKIRPFLFLLLGFVSLGFSVSLASAGERDAIDDEVRLLRQTFQQQVSDLRLEESYVLWACADACVSLATIEAASGFFEPQYFVYVDRNPERQAILVGFYDPGRSAVFPIGWDRVSTGNPKRSGHFLTPVGVFENSTANVGYRAEGTKNSKGWRGLGAKGSRIWDLGWQWTDHYVKKQRDDRQIRLLLHATDPKHGEPRLGRPDSKGCVRISAKLNAFLDRYGILDANYEAKHQAYSWLLDPKRQPVQPAGRYLIVGDSSRREVNSLIAKAAP